MSDTPKSIKGKQNKDARSSVIQFLASIRGQEIAKLSTKDQTTLLVTLCQLLGIADKDGKIS